MAKRTKGKCKYCGKEYTLSYMNKHLPVCEERQKRWIEKIGSKKYGYFELAIYSKYSRDYWMFVEIKETETLKALDQFLRDIWVECCGHLSEFDINGVIYDCDPEDTYFGDKPVKSMFAIHPGVESAVIAEAKFIRISLSRIRRKIKTVFFHRLSKFVWNCMRMV